MKNLLVAIAISAAFLLAGCASKAETAAPGAKTKKCCTSKTHKRRRTAKYTK